MNHRNSNNSAIRITAAGLLGLLMLCAGFVLGTFILAHIAFLLFGGINLVEAVWQNKTTDYVGLGIFAIVVGGSTGAASGVWLWFRIMHRTRFIDDDQIIRIFRGRRMR